MDHLNTEIAEDPRFLTEQIVTYLGNKRALLPFIGEALQQVKLKLGTSKISIFDAFSGSGIVSRFFKAHASHLMTNDLEDYARTINGCYLSNPDRSLLQELALDFELLQSKLLNLTWQEAQPQGIIAQNYAPSNDVAIKLGERAFYSRRNARFLDNARQLIAQLPEDRQKFFLAPLLARASVHANTGGVFKGFYKDSKTGIGSFGGRKGDALARILGEISLDLPVFSRYSCQVSLYSQDANRLARTLGPHDLAYLDPPYNQHPYGSNYFMLNLILNYKQPSVVSPVSGIPSDWKRSAYNRRQAAFGQLQDLVENLKARFVLISFNSEGFIGYDQIRSFLERHGKLQTFSRPYNTYRASRNLADRSKHLEEYLFLLERR